MSSTYVTWISWFDQRQYDPPYGEPLLITNKNNGSIHGAWWDGTYWHLECGSEIGEMMLWSHPTMPVMISGPFNLDFLRDE